MNALSSKSISTSAGSAATTLLIVNVVQHVSGWNERWFGLLMAVVVSEAAVFMVKQPKTFGLIALGFIHGFMTYATAFGVQNAIIADDPVPVPVVAQAEPVPATHRILFGAPPSVAAPPPKVVLPEKTYRSKW